MATAVTFTMVLVKEILAPSEINPYFGQAVGNTFFLIAMLLVGSPVVIAGAAVLDWLLQGLSRPRVAVAGLALVPAGFCLLLVPLDAVAAALYAAWCLSVGVGTAGLMRLPPRLVPDAEA